MAEKKAKVVTKDEFKNLKPELPPAGFERREELAKRQDNLAAQVEQLAEKDETFAIPHDSEALKEDREILDKLITKDFFHVDLYEKDKYVTCFKECVYNQGAAFWRAKAEGWEVVRRDMIADYDKFKCVSKSPDAEVRVGDVILMYMPIGKYNAMRERQRKEQYMQQFGVESEAYDIATKSQGAVSFYSNLQGDQNNPFMEKTAKRAAQKMALNTIGNKMKRGFVPGIPNR